MSTNIPQSLASTSPSSSILFPIPLKPSTTTTQTKYLPTNSYCGRSIRISPISSTSGGSNNTGSNDNAQQVPSPITPPDTVEIRFQRRGRRRRQLSEDGVSDKQPLKMQTSANTAPAPPKNWEDMSLTEKAIELYLGEKGVLFWLNKFAYASIFIMIGAWILFRFVGPALNLYRLDTPLSPSSIFNGS